MSKVVAGATCNRTSAACAAGGCSRWGLHATWAQMGACGTDTAGHVSAGNIVNNTDSACIAYCWGIQQHLYSCQSTNSHPRRCHQHMRHGCCIPHLPLLTSAALLLHCCCPEPGPCHPLPPTSAFLGCTLRASSSLARSSRSVVVPDTTTGALPLRARLLLRSPTPGLKDPSSSSACRGWGSGCGGGTMVGVLVLVVLVVGRHSRRWQQ